jgi:hypothetical protein
MNISLRKFGRAPWELTEVNHETIADAHTFALQIAVGNKDLNTLELLWSHFSSWDHNDLNKIIDILVEDKWT